MFINNRKSKNHGHYRYLIWVLDYIPQMGLNGVQFCDCSCSCVYCDFEFLKFVFSTLRSRSCFQLTISFLLEGREGLLLLIDIISFLLPIGKFSKQGVFVLYNVRFLFAFLFPILFLLVNSSVTKILYLLLFVSMFRALI